MRELAREMDLAVADKGDSHEICFVPNGDYAAFLNAYLRTRASAGSADARRDRHHRRADAWASTHGVHHFTVGQRQGLGIATGEPLYVIATDAAVAAGTVGGNDELLAAASPRGR